MLLDAGPVPDETPAVFGCASLPVPPAFAAQVGVQVSPAPFVLPYMSADALVADTLRAFQPALSSLLFRAVVLFQQRFDLSAHGFGEADPLRILSHPPLVFPLCETGIVPPAAQVAVALQLTAAHGFVLAYRKCYRTIVAPLSLHHGICAPLLFG